MSPNGMCYLTLELSNILNGCDAAIAFMDHLSMYIVRPHSIKYAIRGVCEITTCGNSLGPVGPGKSGVTTMALRGESHDITKGMYTVIEDDSNCFSWGRDKHTFMNQCIYASRDAWHKNDFHDNTLQEVEWWFWGSTSVLFQPGNGDVLPFWALREWRPSVETYEPLILWNCVLSRDQNASLYINALVKGSAWCTAAPSGGDISPLNSVSEINSSARLNAEYLVDVIGRFVDQLGRGTIAWECDGERSPAICADTIAEMCMIRFGSEGNIHNIP